MAKNENAKFCAILAWFFPVGLIWFFVDDKLRKDRFVEFHVKQSLVFVIFLAIVSVLGMIPIIGWFLIAPIGYLIGLVFFIIGLIYAINNEKKELPVIGKYAKKIKF